ncbi:MAG: lamin tail domain-containing protein [Candidatus Cloacimonetes bacterium]|nr:lamin tail domain-containing protein [Candidatus Cloacimonadota bacterium]
MNFRILLFLFCINVLPAQIVINEVLYDPVGTDTGKEWIELYNSGDSDVNLQGAEILRGGAEYTSVFTFPYFLLRAGRYLCLAEAQIPNAIFWTELGFQNGGDGTDGIRYVSPDGSYTDTVLYDEPNHNLLPDDSGLPGTSFATDVPSGFSLARRANGLDTNNPAEDFIPEPNPTPGLPNRVYCDYRIGQTELNFDADTMHLELSVWIINDTDLNAEQSGRLEIRIDEELLQSLDLPGLAARDSVLLSHSQILAGAYPQVLYLEAFVPDDPSSENNIWSHQFSGSPVELTLSEVMYNPAPGQSEWIELKSGGAAPIARNYSIQDAAGNQGSFDFTAPEAGYYIVCSNPDLFLSQYADFPPGKLIQISNWPALNNEGDSIFLLDEDAVVDSTVYVGQSSKQGISLERDAYGQWRYCLTSLGATPGQVNSQAEENYPSFEGKLHLEGSPFKPRLGEELRIYYQFAEAGHKVNCKIFDLAGRKKRVLANNVILEANGYLIWDGKSDKGKYPGKGLYIILWESQNGSGKVWRRQLTAVIAE